MAGRLIRGLAVALMVGGASVAIGSPAHACRCASLSDADLFAVANAVFTGRAVEEDGGLLSGDGWRFEVEEVYKGTVHEVQFVHTGGDSCAFSFEADERYQVFGRAEGDVLATDRCSGTRTVGSASGFTPTAAAQPEPGSSGGGGTPLWLIVTDVLMVLVALIAIVFGPRILRNRKRDRS